MSPTSRAIKLRELTLSSALRDIGEVRKYMQWATGLLTGTVIAGTLVAEIDAGKEFNTFPKMGDHWIPGGLFDLSVSVPIGCCQRLNSSVLIEYVVISPGRATSMTTWRRCSCTIVCWR